LRIVYFDLDTTRADHLGPYGYERDTTPVLDDLASESVVFENNFASDTPCLPSRAALFSCRPGISNGVISHESPGYNFRFPAREGMAKHYPEYKMPMRLLQENGYHTITFSVYAQRHAAWWFNSGFSEVSNPSWPTGHEQTDTINPRVKNWIKENVKDEEDLFLHINYMDAHTPYSTKEENSHRSIDEECFERVSRGPLPDFPDEETIKYHNENVYGPKTARDIMIRQPDNNYNSPWEYMPDEISNLEEFKLMLDAYDSEIAKMDKAIGAILDLLREEEVLDETVIIVSGDHGEAIGEQGMYFEHGVAVDAVANLPLMVRWPGVTDSGRRCGEMVYQYDFMATIMDLLDIDIPRNWEARPFTPALCGEEFEGRPYVVYGMGIFTLQRAVRTDDYTYVKTFHPGPYPYKDRYLFEVGEPEIESNDLQEKEPETLAEMEKLYSEWWNDWCMGPNAVVDPFHLQTPSFEYFPVEQMFDRLEFLGRDDQIADLKERLKTRRRQKETHPFPQSRY